jgi:hypothetical protein
MRDNLYNRLTIANKLILSDLSDDMPIAIQSIIDELKLNTSVLELKFRHIIEIQNFLQPKSISSNDIYKLFKD